LNYHTGLFIILLLPCQIIHAQEDTTSNQLNIIWSTTKPEPPADDSMLDISWYYGATGNVIDGLDQEFIYENLEVPENTPEGTVMIAFKINQDGIPYDIEVVESLTNDADQEALRVIQLLKIEPETDRIKPFETSLKVGIQFRKRN
jgi:TonB family protein